MKNLNVVALSTVLALSTASVALAGGTGVTNRYTNRVSDGYGKVQFSGYESYDKFQINESGSIKVETYGGDINTSIANYRNGELSGTAISTNRQIVDPVSIISTSSQLETVSAWGYSQFNGFERYNFTETVDQHDVESYSF